MVKAIAVSLISAASIYAADVTIFYKSGGIKAIQKKIAQEMESISYWSGNLLNKDLRFGYFESPICLLECTKEKGQLELYTCDSQKRFTLKKRYNALTGKFPGDKMTEGDHRTPIGIYTLTEKKKKVDPFYGPMAFVTSYPNLYDRIRGKNGSGIWIHGVPLVGTRDEFTKGCIALNNDDLIHLDQYINPAKTLLVIDSSMKKPKTTNTYSTILAGLYRWKDAWEDNDLETYLSFYGPTFKRSDGMDINQFKLYKERIFSKNEEKTIRFSNINILPYPGDNRDLFYITFDEEYNSENHQFKGSKALLILLNPDTTFSIITED